jgi:hypothetical protein
MDTFKVICLPFAVLLLAIAVVMPPPTRAWVRWILAGVALVLAAIALFLALDSVP